ncbi:hypothetical protein RSAG8_06898, partial [Rhizoctonia solani AG-8 WAC10335]
MTNPFDRLTFTPNILKPPLEGKRIFNKFIVDAKQDLIIPVEYDDEWFVLLSFPCIYSPHLYYLPRLTVAHIRLYHSSTGKPHSLARFPTPTVRFEGPADEEPSPGFLYGTSLIIGDILVTHLVPVSSSDLHHCDTTTIWAGDPVSRLDESFLILMAPNLSFSTRIASHSTHSFLNRTRASNPILQGRITKLGCSSIVCQPLPLLPTESRQTMISTCLLVFPLRLL